MPEASDERDENGLPIKPAVPAILEAVLEETPDVAKVRDALKEDPSCASVADSRGRTVLSHAAARGSAEIVSALLEAGAEDSSPSGWTAAQYAAFNGHADVLRALLKAGGAAATSCAPPGTSSMPPLMCAAVKGQIDCLTVLLDAVPAAMDARTTNGRTALMLAASGGSPAAVELLVDRGADLNATSHEGKTALIWAVTSHKPETVGALAKLGANPDVCAPISKTAPIIPGQDREKGESAEDFANGKHNKDPCLRHIAKYLREWREVRTATPGASAPAMPPLPWVQHAIEEKAKAEAEEAAKPPAEDEDAIASGEATAPIEDDNDIFGGDDEAVGDAPAKEAPSLDAPSKKVAIVDVTAGEDAAAPAEGDLDALD